MSNTILESIHAFPIKGFPGVSLSSTRLKEGDGIPNDRRYAVTRGVAPSGNWMPARNYYINSQVDGMMMFRLDQASDCTVKITNPAGQDITIDPRLTDSITLANLTLPRFMKHVGVKEDLPPPQLVERSNLGNWDYPDTPISIINAGTVRAISDGLGVAMDALRYRGNLVLNGLPAFDEFAYMGKRIRIGKAEIEVMRPIVRCPTPGVNTATGERDIDFEKLLPETFGHAYCGMYAIVVKTGEISTSDTVTVIGDAEISLETASLEAEDYRLWPRIVEVSNLSNDENETRMSLKATGPWPLPEAKLGQRLRFIMGPHKWTSEYIADASSDQYHLTVEKSPSDDPVTEHLRTAYSTGDQLIVCGPFGRV